MKLFGEKQTGTNIPGRRRAQTNTERRNTSVSEERAVPVLSQTFRRGRTLTGSYSSDVTSVSEQSAELKSSRVHAHDLRRQRRHLGLYLFMTILAMSALYLATTELIATPSLRANVASGLDERNYSKSLHEYLTAHPVERFTFSLNLAHLTKTVQIDHPEVKTIEVSDKHGFGRIEFYMTMRKPLAGWVIDSKQQYVDEDGIVFTKNYFDAPGVNIVDKSGIEAVSGKLVASNRFLGFVGKVVGNLTAFGLQATEVTIPRGTTRQIEVKLRDVPYYFKLSVDRGAGEQAEDAARVVRYVERQQGMNIEYADIRIAGKVFYRDK